MPASDEGATQPPPEPTLLELARKKFATFSPAEEELFRAAQEGRGVSRLTGDEKEDNPGNAANWDADRIVRGECIAWLCTDTQASALVTYRGLELYGMRIDADVNLNDAEIKFPLKAWMCAFSGDVLLQNAQLKGLYLLGCLLKSLNAGGANIRGAVLLCDEFEAEGEVNLMRATIDGNLECDGQLSNPKGRALSADGTKIGGSVFLKNGFKAEGEVNLLGTTIGGDLDCKGAQLSNPKGRALNANRTKIGGSVFLNDGFQAEGEVNLWGATIEGELDCAGGARLSNAEGNALSADGINIGGSVFLRDGFHAEGEVSLSGATIDGDMDCTGGAQLSNAEGYALRADGMKVRGSVVLKNGFGAEGEVNLAGTTIDGNLECDGQLSNAKGWALRADGIKIGSSVFLRDGFQAEGEVNLTGAAIDGDLDCAGAQLSNAKGWALSAGRMKVGGSVFLRNGFRAEGEVRLAGATINVTLDCAKAQFSNSSGRALAVEASKALTVEASKIGGGVLFRDGFQAQGEISLFGATIRELQIVDVLEAEQTILDLRFAEVGTFWDDEKSWPKAGNLLLDGFRYERLYEESPLQAGSRIKWLRRQPPGKFLAQPYEQLAAVLRQMGHDRDARLVMIEKNRERARFTRFPLEAWWWYNVFGRLIGYGYAPLRAFAMSVAMILLGTFLFHLGDVGGLVTPATENAYAKAPNGQLELDKSGRPKVVEDYPVFHAFVYSIESFIPLIKFDQTANWRPNANRSSEISIFHRQVPTGRLLRYYLYCHIAAGWLLTSLWVGAVTGLVKS